MKSIMAGLTFETRYAVTDRHGCILSMTYLASSEAKCLAIAQAFGIEDVRIRSGRYGNYTTYGTRKEKYERFLVRKSGGYQTWYKGVIMNTRVGKDVLFTTKEKWKDDLFERLAADFHLPLLKEWTDYLADTCMDNHYAGKVNCPFVEPYPAEEPMEVFGTDGIRTDEMIVIVLNVNENNIKEMVAKGIASGKICVTGEAQNPLGITELDPYIFKFHESIGENLKQEVLHPKSGYVRYRNVEGLALKTKKLFPPQADSVNGIVAAMEAGDSYVFMAMDMGTGKTTMSASAVEAYYNRKWLKEHPGKRLKDCFLSKEVTYRVAVMCPSHMCEKWKRECEAEIPGAKGIIVSSLSQLVYLREHPDKKGKEFFIFSKEIAKNDTFKRPVPTKMRFRKPAINICADCYESSLNEENEQHRLLMDPKRILTRWDMGGFKTSPVKMEGGHPTCVVCGSNRTRKVEMSYYWENEKGMKTDKWYGLCCPNCDGLLMAYSASFAKGAVSGEDLPKYILMPEDFSRKTQTNECCQLCGTALWEDNVDNYRIYKNRKPVRMEPKKKSKWHKIKFFANHAKLKANKMDKTAYALAGHEIPLVKKEGVMPEQEMPYVEAAKSTGPRRYSLARYCKKYLKGVFDIVIADEAHLYEGIKTEQSIALHDLMKCAKFSMLLTGTLTNGTSSSLFAIHWMVNPKKMKELGYEYTSKSLADFNGYYGVVETKYEFNECGINAQGRGRQIGTPRIKPGISPMVYPDLLLDNSIMLNIGDMSNKLPELNEYVEEIDLPADIYKSYKSLMKDIRNALNNPPIGAGILGTMLQAGLSYPDKPYGRDEIWSLKVKDCRITTPGNLSHYRTTLTPKEERLVEIVNKEISESRNVFVYTEYSGKEESDVDGHLKEIIEKKCGLTGAVEVIKSGDVAATKREEYIQSLSGRIKVFITNYRNVETGIDFVGEYKGRKFNYPSIIFYQTGCSLSSVWQASRRHYRLNQTKECRTYYLVYKNTYQRDILEMMAKKISAASAIQGNFSASALENMSGGIEDPTVALAKKLMKGDTGGTSTMDVAASLKAQRELASKASEDDEGTFIGPEPVTYYDVVGKDNGYEDIPDLFAEFLMMNDTGDKKPVLAAEKKEPVVVDEDIEDIFAVVVSFGQQDYKKEASVFGQSKKKAAVVGGQMGLFA